MALIFGSKYSFVLRQQFASEIILRTKNTMIIILDIKAPPNTQTQYKLCSCARTPSDRILLGQWLKNKMLRDEKNE